MLNHKNKKTDVTPIIIVGTGHHFQRNLMPAVLKLKKENIAKVLATVDILNRGEVGLSKKTGHIKRNNGPIHKQLAEFKKQNPLVILGHTNSLHAKDAFDLLSNGFRVAVEKPYALDSKALRKFIKIGGKNKCTLLEYYLSMKSIALLLGYGLINPKSFYFREWLIKPLPALTDYAHSVEDFSGKLFDIIGKVNRVEVEVLEGKGETGTLEGRGIDTIDIKFGGGMIQDMATHALAPLLALESVIGVFPNNNDYSVKTAYCREYIKMAKSRFALPVHRIGETYAEMSFKTSKEVDVIIRLGKYVFGDRNRRGVLISGSKGEVYLDMNDCSLYINGRPVLALDKSYYPVIRAAIEEVSNKPLFDFSALKVSTKAQDLVFNIQKIAVKNKERIYYNKGEKPEQIFEKVDGHVLSEGDIRPEDNYNRWLKLLDKDLHRFFPVGNRQETACPGCQSRDFDSEFVKLGFVYKWCKKCFTLYASPRPPEAQIDEFYRHSKAMKFYGDKVFKSTLDSRYEHQIMPLSDWVVELVSKHAPQARNILDFMPKFYSVWAHFPNDSKRKISLVEPVHLTKVPISATKISFQQSKKKKYDLLTAFDVLDHRSDIRKTVKYLSDICASGGILFLTLNSGSGFEYQILGRDSHRLVPPTKFNLLTIEAIRDILLENNFDIIDFSTPGKLDVDIVTKTLQDNRSGPILRFLSYFFNYRDAKAREEFQHFLSSNNLSSFLRIAAKKRK